MRETLLRRAQRPRRLPRSALRSPGVRLTPLAALAALFVIGAACDGGGILPPDGEALTLVSVSMGESHTCALSDGGAAYCWGGNDRGQLGTGDFDDRSSPARVVGGLVFTQLSAGERHTCAIAQNRTVYCWGEGRFGRLGDGDTLARNAPAAISSVLTFVQVSAGGEHTCAIHSLVGAAYCWGRNDVGQLGTPRDPIPWYAEPVPVTGGRTFAEVSGGADHTCARTYAGLAYCWGNNTYGELGLGVVTALSDTPVVVSGSASWRAIVASHHSYTCGVASDSLAYCWGRNDSGMLGRGTTSDRELDVAPTAGGVRFLALDAYGAHACGLAVDGALHCWGENLAGWGDGTTGQYLAPTQVTETESFTSVSAGPGRTCGMGSDGRAYCWGASPTGDGTWEARTTPVEVDGQD